MTQPAKCAAYVAEPPKNKRADCRYTLQAIACLEKICLVVGHKHSGVNAYLEIDFNLQNATWVSIRDVWESREGDSAHRKPVRGRRMLCQCKRGREGSVYSLLRVYVDCFEHGLLR